MGDEKRFILFLVLTTALLLVMPQVMQLIWGPPARPAGQQANAPADKAAQAPKEAKEPAGGPPAKPPDSADVKEPTAVAQAPAAEAVAEAEAPRPAREPELERRTLGSTDPDSGFKMQVTVTTRGGAVERIELAEFKSEDRSGPLRLLSAAEGKEASFLLGLEGAANKLERRNWEIVPVQIPDDDSTEAVRLQTALPERGLQIIKTYKLKKDTFSLDLTIEVRNLTQQPKGVVYRLAGPQGFVLEGAWYASKLRDAVIGGGRGGDLKRQTLRAIDLVKGADAQMKELQQVLAKDGEISREKWPLNAEWFSWFDRDGDGKLSREETAEAADHLAGGDKNRWMALPLRFAGVEGQYFCVLLVVPPPATEEARWDAATSPVLGKRNNAIRDRSDVSVEIESQKFDLAADESLQHTYSIYAGPRQQETLENTLGDRALAQSLMNYRWMLFIPDWVVGFFANLMLLLLRLFHGWVHNWGVAIIMLTVVVRLLMFPISRKQALAAARMQSLKPDLDALKEKYKDDKEKFARAQMELWRKHGVNPMGGCLPILIQMPIFIGLWQGLSGSVDLRHATLIGWIDNLAAPDALFHWGENIPLVSSILGPYFNLLPVVLIGLFLVQQKMFMPPKADPPDPQMEMQQKMMIYMLVVFGYFMYRLPSGLCIYYVASTAWGIAERKFLPKLQHAKPSSEPAGGDKDGGGRRGPGGSGPDGKQPPRSGKGRAPSGRNGRSWREQLRERLQELLKQAEKK